MEASCGCRPNETAKPVISPEAEIVVVTSPGCHLCVSALAEIEELATEFPLNLRTVDIGSPEGADILRAHRPPAPPVFLVDGEFLGFGRLPRRKLRKLLQAKESR
jgi:hypothetical protein